MMELSFAETTEVGFLERDSRHLQLDPLQPGQEAMFIATPDGEGITLIGSTRELMDFAHRMVKTIAVLEASQLLGGRHWSESPEGGYTASPAEQWDGETINCATPLWRRDSQDSQGLT